MDGLMVIGMLLLIAGFVLVGTEMVLPGFGAPGITGGICLVAGIFLTADSNPMTEVECLNCGAEDFIVKPFERGKVLDSIRKVLVMKI